MHFFDVESGQSEKIQVPLCSSRTYGLPTNSSDALPLRVIRVSYGLSVPVFVVSEGRWSTSAKEFSDFSRVSPSHH